MAEKIGSLGFAGPHIDIKQLKWPGKWKRYNAEDHVLNLPLPMQPKQYQLEIIRAKNIRQLITKRVVGKLEYEK